MVHIRLTSESTNVFLVYTRLPTVTLLVCDTGVQCLPHAT